MGWGHATATPPPPAPCSATWCWPRASLFCTTSCAAEPGQQSRPTPPFAPRQTLPCQGWPRLVLGRNLHLRRSNLRAPCYRASMPRVWVLVQNASRLPGRTVATCAAMRCPSVHVQPQILVVHCWCAFLSRRFFAAFGTHYFLEFLLFLVGLCCFLPQLQSRSPGACTRLVHDFQHYTSCCRAQQRAACSTCPRSRSLHTILRFSQAARWDQADFHFGFGLMTFPQRAPGS